MHGMEKVSPNDTFLNNQNNTNDMNITTDKDHTPTHYKIYEALEDLQDGNKITQQRVADYTGLSIITVKRNWLESFKELVKEYNQSLKIVQPERSNTEIIPAITRAIVALQDTVVTKESIAEYSGLPLTVVEQHWSAGLNDLVSRVNSKVNKSGIAHAEPEDDHTLLVAATFLIR